MATTFAFKMTKFSLDVASAVTRAEVRMHNLHYLEKDMSIIFVVNHFTRLETLMLPYQILKNTGLRPWSMAAGVLYTGRVGKFLRSIGTVSTKDPDRDRVVISSLLSGDMPWIIFPEGAMIKDKKMIDAEGEFRVWGKSGRRPPHTGAAALALRAEYYRRKIRCIRDNPNSNGMMGDALAKFDLENFDEADRRRTVIVPINITYFPIRSRKNLLFSMAKRFVKDLSQRAIEELSLEGASLGKGSDIDITLGEPIDIRDYLDRPEFAELMACSDDDIDKLEEDPRSVFNDVARELMVKYMRAIYRMTTVNFDHIFANIIRFQTAKTFTERAYRNRIFMAAHELLKRDDLRFQTELREHYANILFEDPSPEFDSFVELCAEDGILERDGRRFKKDFNLPRGESEIHEVRMKELTYVIANEIEPLGEVVKAIKRAARIPRAEVSRTIREMFQQEDERIFDEDYAEFHDGERTKSPDVGRPFLLRPPKIRAGIVLVHGYLAAPLEIRSMAEYFFLKGYAVYGVRLKGHGTSPEDLSSTRWEEWYESFNRGFAVIKSLTDNIILGGFSTGGGLALLAAGRKRGSVQAVFSINAPLQLRNYAVRMVPSVITVNRLLGRVRRRRKQWDYVKNLPENAHINYERNPMAGIRELGRAMGTMEGALKDICVPTLILQGSRDPAVDPDSGRLIFHQVGTQDKELVILDRDRHGIINGEGSIDVFDRVDFFLEWAARRKDYACCD